MRTRWRAELEDGQCVRDDIDGSRSRRAQCARASHLALLGALPLILANAVSLAATVWASPGMSSAYVARVLEIRDEGHLHFVRSSGELIIDEGRATGSFPGRVTVRFLYNGEPVVAARFTIYGSGGSLSAHGTARLNRPMSQSPSFKGSMVITSGNGRYAHAHGRGEIYGVYYRHNYALTVQAVAAVHY